MEHLDRYASSSQMGRFQHQMGILFVAWNQEADWHRNGATPPVWEYLVQRHLNSYLPPMILIDPVASYELPPHEFYDPRGSAGVHDGRARERAAERPVLGGLRVGHGLQPAAGHRRRGEMLVAGRDQAHGRDPQRADALFVDEATVLSLTGSPMLQRFFLDTWAWLGGSREWHATTGRYQTQADA